jgi:hypothetical protein
MSAPPEPEITRLLAEWHDGNQAALGVSVATISYEMRLARAWLRREMEQ